MNSYRARMAVGLLIPLAALAGCSSGSSSAKSTQASKPSTTSASSTAATKASATPDAQTKRAATQKQLEKDVVNDPNGVKLLWTQSGTGAEGFELPKAAGAVRIQCSGGGTVTMKLSTDKPQQFDCSIPIGETILFSASKQTRFLQMTPSNAQIVWAAAAWSGLRNQ